VTHEASLGAVACSLICGGSHSSPTPTPPPPVSMPSVKLTTVVTDLLNPVDLQIADDSLGRLFVVEQKGRVRIISNGAVLPSSFLDLSAIVSQDGGELGLLGITFHPDFANHPLFYLNYTKTQNPGGVLQTVIAQFQVSSGDPNQADAGSQQVLLTVDQSFANHKAGQLAFGNDGFLYFGLGDGGSGGDPHGNGQNSNTYLGKMLRLDVDHPGSGKPYGIPPGNLFPGGVGGLPEIYAYGFRNPWRFSFDRTTGQTWSRTDLASGAFQLASFGQDASGELYVVDFGGTISKIVNQ
jgi:glucose/arabinose dehydrogenase